MLLQLACRHMAKLHASDVGRPNMASLLLSAANLCVQHVVRTLTWCYHDFMLLAPDAEELEVILRQRCTSGTPAMMVICLVLGSKGWPYQSCQHSRLHPTISQQCKMPLPTSGVIRTASTPFFTCSPVGLSLSQRCGQAMQGWVSGWRTPESAARSGWSCVSGHHSPQSVHPQHPGIHTHST